MPALPLIQAGIGVAQGIIGGIRAHKAQKELEKLGTPAYTPNQGIGDYYNKALARYNASPYESATYKNQTNQISRNVATGISGLNDRRSAIGGISSIIQGANDASLKAISAAEGEQGQRLGQLGNAAQAKASDDKYAFQINKLMPYEKKYNLLTAKAQGGNQVMNAGLQNIFGGLQSGQETNFLNKMYGSNQGSDSSMHSAGRYWKPSTI